VVRFNQEPLDILIFGYNWGVLTQPLDNMPINLAKLSQLCKDELGFEIRIAKCRDTINRNSYAVEIASGRSFDLVFPKKFLQIQSRSVADDFWSRKYLDDGIYMDISPYLAQFCPEAILNFERYPQIKRLCTIEDKIYAIYAGMPDIYAPALFVKNEFLEQYNIEYIHDFDTLYNILQGIYADGTGMEDTDKVLLHNGSSLPDLIICSSGWRR
jgi:hypothetical protein